LFFLLAVIAAVSLLAIPVTTVRQAIERRAARRPQLAEARVIKR
jgi:hypothetical protein